MIIDSSGVYLERSKPDINPYPFTQNKLRSTARKLHPKQVVADNSNYKNAQNDGNLVVKQKSLSCHRRKGFFKQINFIFCVNYAICHF
jgi:hypothetical protein